MKRMNILFAAVVAAAIVTLVAGAPVAQAQTQSCGSGCTVHFVGAGSSAQFEMAAIAADQAAFAANSNSFTGVKHWSKKYNSGTGDGAYLGDNRNAAIVNQYGNVWVVWHEASGAVTDLWLDVSVDSTVGNRCVLAQETAGSGCQVQITSANGTASDSIIPANLYPDNAADVAIDLAALNAVNTAISGGVHVNVGLTDIRPEDASYATKERLICTAARGATNTCLGDQIATNVGGNIVSNQGTGAFAQPVGFALPGEKDPFNTSKIVPTTFITYPIGAAPVVFVANNNGASFPLNLVSGVTPDIHVAGQVYPLANLFDGSTSCDTNNKALGGSGTVGGTAITIFLREPLSGTMNTTEFSLFRSFGNTDDTQEGANGGAAMNFTGGAAGTGTPCTGNGLRSRAIGTGEVVGSSSPAYGVLGTPDSLGYIFTGWSNYNKYKASSHYQYETLDGVDPLFAAPGAYNVCVGGTAAGTICGTAEGCAGGGSCTGTPAAGQIPPYCTAAVCSNDMWPAYTDPHTGSTAAAGATFPNLRNGTYKAWSIYRWVAESTDTDPYGPALVAQEAQNYVDSDVTDFVPFAACAPGTGSACLSGTPTDGLSVYHSHFNAAGVVEKCPGTRPNNGSASNPNALTNGNTLGGGDECSSDVGGFVEGAFGTTSPYTAYVDWHSALVKGKGYQILYKNGDTFASSGFAAGTPVTLTCTGSNGAQSVTQTTVEDVVGADYYLSAPNPSLPITFACRLIGPDITHAAAAAPGVTNKHQ